MHTIAMSLNAIEDSAFQNELDRLRNSMLAESEIEATIVASTATLGVSLSVGYVFWLLRGGMLVSSLLSSLPAWRLVDPMPILSRLGDDEDDDDDDSLESMLARQNPARGLRKPEPSETGHQPPHTQETIDSAPGTAGAAAD